MKKEKKSQPQFRKSFVKSPNYSVSCADEIRLRVTEQSFLLTFSVAIDFTEESGGVKVMTLEDQGALMITPRHAKRLSKALADAIAKYEQDVGPIPDRAGEDAAKPH